MIPTIITVLEQANPTCVRNPLTKFDGLTYSHKKS